MADMNGAGILIVEDSATQAEELQYTLEKHGYSATIARNGTEALGAIRKRRPTLVVSDIVMPEMDGFTLCRKIKSETFSEIPVILLTALSDPEDVLKGLECGADNFITKPYDADYLLARIDQVLVNTKLRSESKLQAGVEIYFKEQKYFITSERRQVLDLLLSTYETAVMKNEELKEAQKKLAAVNERLEKTVQERTAALVEEIEERRRAEEAAKTERRRLYDVLETLPAMICLLTPDYHVAFANRSFREKFGASGGRHCYEYCFGRAEPCDFCESYKVLETGKPHHWEVTTPDGGTIIDAYDFPFTDVDGSPMILEMDIDITERKQTEAELARHRKHLEELVHERTTELEAFIYSVSHDLRMPLRSIFGFSELLVKDYSDKLDERGKRHLGLVVNGAEKMNQIIDDLLHLSRISRRDIDRQNVDMSKIAVSVAAELCGAQPHCLSAFDIKRDVTAYADPHLIGVALSNLLGNAWKFTSKTINRRIEFGAFEREGKTAYYVKDNGAGFDPHFAQRLFLPFHRLHTEQEFPGTGIGLAIVERVIRRHGGKIWAEGKVNEGAAFFFTLG